MAALPFTSKEGYWSYLPLSLTQKAMIYQFLIPSWRKEEKRPQEKRKKILRSKGKKGKDNQLSLLHPEPLHTSFHPLNPAVQATPPNPKPTPKIVFHGKAPETPATPKQALRNKRYLSPDDKTLCIPTPSTKHNRFIILDDENIDDDKDDESVFLEKFFKDKSNFL